MPDATLSSKHQLVLPAAVRKQLGINPGDQIDVQVEGDHAILRKVPKSYVQALETITTASSWKGYARKLKDDRGQWDRER
ncbi:MAG: AbrB/MazE/SpoVT family DNA-binding domain-containing protein [Nitrospirales bacterium]|nr:AbrB/MazE/SpoVT family DNA-binding domain-containing protein [Nitrospira sp.]MDR4500868.1 AbrB/MazE/SpoVT family DNA-binding domain-containing protein [Nitrospirales bacterium]